MDWYTQFTQIVSVFSEPLGTLYYSQKIPVIAAFLLGMIGALAPCQISTNIGVISYTANRMTNSEKWYSEIIIFFLAKTLVYFSLGLLVLFLGKGIENLTIPIFQLTKKLLGPLFVIIGLYFVGWIKIRSLFTERLLKFKFRVDQLTGSRRAFFLGLLLSLAFCPTMFLLFFGLLLPLVASTSGYGFTLPLFFSLGTFLPVLLFLGVSFGLGMDKAFLKTSKKIGKVVQVISGVIFILLGINDIFLYWM